MGCSMSSAQVAPADTGVEHAHTKQKSQADTGAKHTHSATKADGKPAKQKSQADTGAKHAHSATKKQKSQAGANAVKNFVVEVWLSQSRDALSAILHASPEVRRPFTAFVESEFNENHLFFFYECESMFAAEAELDESKREDLFRRALAVHEKFVAAGAAEEVNVPARLQKNLSRKDFLPQMHAAQEEVLRLLAFDVFPRFIRSRYCEEMLQELERGAQGANAGALSSGLVKGLRDELDGAVAVAQGPTAAPQSTGSARWLDLLAHTSQLLPVCVAVSDCSVRGVPLVFVNREFTKTTGYDLEFCKGRNCKFLQGPETEPDAIEQLREAIRTGMDVRLSITNYRKDGTKFRNFLTMRPCWEELRDDEDISEDIAAGRLIVTRPRRSGGPGNTTPIGSGSMSAAMQDESGSASGSGVYGQQAMVRLRMRYFVAVQFEAADHLEVSQLVRHDALLRLLPDRVLR